MFACCNFCYERFIEKDGTIEKGFLTKHFGEDAAIVVEEDKDSPWGKQCFERNGYYPKQTFVVHSDKKEEFCTCGCHQKNGITIMH